MDIIKIIIPTVLAFFIGISITPFFTQYFYKYKMWKKVPRVNPKLSKTFSELHDAEMEASTPRVGGIIIWSAVLFTVFIIYLLSMLLPSELTLGLNFFSRSQTLVPLAAFFFAAFVGLSDDILQINGLGAHTENDLLYRKVKIALVGLIGFAISLWFYFKLDFRSIHIPFDGTLELGLWFIPFFILVMLATFSTSVIDGLDGLSGGVLSSAFTAFSVIAFANSQFDISALCGSIAGAILAFLWFNVPPARFYMGETGIMALTVVLSVVSFLTDSVLLLPIIAFPLVASSFSVIVQMLSVRFFNGHKVFKVAPLHHHFQALGWSKEKVVMRYWIVSVISAFAGVILSLVS